MPLSRVRGRGVGPRGVLAPVDHRAARRRQRPAGAAPRRTRCQASHRPANCAACGLVLCPASFMIAGTSGSDTKLCQPSSSQSKITQTRSCSDGSRKMRAPLDPCCLRFSAPLVEKISWNWSKFSTCVVARSICGFLSRVLNGERRHDLPAAPARLRPELVPGVEVLEVLPAISYPAVLELEDDAVGNVQVLAVSVP